MTTVVTKDYETGTSGAVTVKVGSDTYGKEGGSGILEIVRQAVCSSPCFSQFYRNIWRLGCR